VPTRVDARTSDVAGAGRAVTYGMLRTMDPTVTSTWESRDLPVLTAIVRQLDQHAGRAFPDVADLIAETGLSQEDVTRACMALDGEYIRFERRLGTGLRNHVAEVSGEARRMVGQWPSPDAYADRLLAAFERLAVEAPTEEQRSRARKAVEGFAGAGRDVLVAAAASILSGAAAG
jgi:hypothetical protein